MTAGQQDNVPGADQLGNPLPPRPDPAPPLPAGFPQSPFPPWLKLPDDGPATLLPPWPDRLVAAPNKQAALTWVERLSLPLRHKRSLLTSWGAYTGVALSAGDFAYLSDFQAPRGPA